MKYYLLPLLVLLSACSNSNEAENTSSDFNPPGKLIRSMYPNTLDCSNGEIPDNYLKASSIIIYYTNNLLTGSDAYDCDYNCDVLISCSSELSWWDQYISTGMSYYNEFPITTQGEYSTISYLNNYVISSTNNDGNGLFHYYNWEDGKLMNITTFLQNDILHGSVDFTYSNLTNLTGLFTVAPWGETGFFFPSDPLALMGASGNITSNLPSSIVAKRWNHDTGNIESITTANFIYQLDNEGYVTSFETISPNGFKYTTIIEYQ
tara:strand:- start:1461 stop:2249 length:789 start_codon:yes stop_codon:yes gene_type:complete